MNYTKIQQGDVLLLKVSEDVFEENKDTRSRTKFHNERAVLAEGEGTGHAHAIYMEDLLDGAEVILCNDGDYDRQNRGIIVTGKPVELRHEEHNTITLEPGFYLQRIVKEYDHISGITRRVAD
tara:strand:- start:4632 stop:5000 length:369 start_codon:yes stop_codon:yes gene_type:complete